jgi:hypothetical protein
VAARTYRTGSGPLNGLLGDPIPHARPLQPSFDANPLHARATLAGDHLRQIRRDAPSAQPAMHADTVANAPRLRAQAARNQLATASLPHTDNQ